MTEQHPAPAAPGALVEQAADVITLCIQQLEWMESLFLALEQQLETQRHLSNLARAGRALAEGCIETSDSALHALIMAKAERHASLEENTHG